MAQPQKLDQAGLLSRRAFVNAAAAVGLATLTAFSPIGTPTAQAEDNAQQAAMTAPQETISTEEAIEIADRNNAVVLLVGENFSALLLDSAVSTHSDAHRILTYKSDDADLNGKIQLFIDNQPVAPILTETQFATSFGYALREFGGNTVVAEAPANSDTPQNDQS